MLSSPQSSIGDGGVQKSEAPVSDNIITLECIVVADGQWYASETLIDPTWSNKVDERTAQRFPIDMAWRAIGRLRRRTVGTFTSVGLQLVA